MLTDELGITTLASLEVWCQRFGAAPPTEKEWRDEFGNNDPPLVNDPTDGIVVISLDDIRVVEEQISTKKKKRNKIVIDDNS